jgi:hypothetical protein
MDRRTFLAATGGLGWWLAGPGGGPGGGWAAGAGEPPPGPQVGAPAPPPELRNPWPEEWEHAFRRRAAHALKALAAERMSGGTSGENEKNYYPRAMAHVLAGDARAGLAALQAEDADAGRDHAQTRGIDFYWCFTLKGQVRKYFLLGDRLDPAYRRRMLEGARAWTAEDPLRRPHPVHGKGNPPKGEAWGPDAKGSWVDVRSTDNLRAMRETSVYLFAEEAGNEATRRLYKARIAEYAAALYRVGMSEWDSENYHGHTLAPYHNLYDFAKDPEVRALAKAALDWLYAAAAVKYRRGAFGGPNCRDYGGANVVFGGNVTHALALYFGDTAGDDPRPDRDDVHHVTSPYRPPRAVVELARKRLETPCGLTASKPRYGPWKPGDKAEPRFFETQHFGATFQMGSVVSAEPEATWNVSPFKLVADNSQRGADVVAANTIPLGEKAEKRPGDRIGQRGNLLLWLQPADGRPVFHFQWPASAGFEAADGVWFVRLEKTWLALRPIRLGKPEPGVIPEKRKDHYARETFLKAAAESATGFCGFALEVGEGMPFEDFRRSATEGSRPDLSRLDAGEATLTGSGGGVRAVPGTDLPEVAVDGVAVDWSRRADVYRGPMIEQGLLSGRLRVTAGGWSFESSIDADGKCSFRETPAAAGK